MKNILAPLMAVMVLAPVIAFLCFCCPAALAADDSGVSIHAAGCDCGQILEWDRDPGIPVRFEPLTSNSLKNFWPRTTSADSSAVVLESHRPDRAPTVLGPPGFSPSSPLYLTLEILRI